MKCNEAVTVLVDVGQNFVELYLANPGETIAPIGLKKFVASEHPVATTVERVVNFQKVVFIPLGEDFAHDIV